MDRLEICDLLRDCCRMGGYAEGNDPPPNWTRLINEAYREIASETEYNWEDTTITTTADTAEYALTTSSDKRDWIRITDVLYGTTTRLYLSSELQERALNPLWTQASSGTPARFFISRPNEIRLCPAPDTSSDTVYVHGCRNPAELSADTDVPTIPLRNHKAIPLRAAWNHLRFIATGDEYKRAQNYLDESRSLSDAIKAEIDGQRRTIRRNARPSADRIYTGGYFPVRRV